MFKKLCLKLVQDIPLGSFMKYMRKRINVYLHVFINAEYLKGAIYFVLYIHYVPQKKTDGYEYQRKKKD